MQNFSPISPAIEELQKIDQTSRAKLMGHVAPFEDMIPHYSNKNNTYTKADDFDQMKRPVAQ